MTLSDPSTHLLNNSRNGDATTSLGSLFSMLDNIFYEDICPNIHPKLSLAQLEALSSFLLLVTWEVRPLPTFLQVPFVQQKRVIRTHNESPFVQVKQHQFPQHLLSRLFTHTHKSFVKHQSCH